MEQRVELFKNLARLTQARAAGGDDLIISMDGGVGRNTIAACARAGTDVFVAGSSVFDESDYAAAVANLRKIAADSRPGC